MCVPEPVPEITAETIIYSKVPRLPAADHAHRQRQKRDAAPRRRSLRKLDFQRTCRVAAKRSTQRTWSAVSGTCKPRARVSRLKASSGANPSAVSNAARSKEERPIEALQWTATLRPAWASALTSSTKRENDAVDGGVSRSGMGKDRKTIPLASQSSASDERPSSAASSA